MKILGGAVLSLLLTGSAFAQHSFTIETAEHAEHGQYLTDGEGRPVYVFSTDTQATEDQPARVSCTSAECIADWPPVSTDVDPQAGEGVDADLLGTFDHDDRQIVTHDGWPLYYFAGDEGSEGPQGHEVESFGGIWTLAAPVTDVSGNADAGQSLYAGQCAQCHGRTGRGMASFPPLTGKSTETVTHQLTQYRAGETIGPNSALMIPVAARLSDQDIADLAAYIDENF